MNRTQAILAACLLSLCSATSLNAASRVTQHGITWTFDRDYPAGRFATGDYWVVGPVTVVGISTALHDPGFAPGPDDDGSMVNPGAGATQGYDGSIHSYRADLNAGRPNGRPVSAENPLVLKPHSSLVSMVSWLYTSSSNKEQGTPAFNRGTRAPRPVTRSAAILTVLPEPAPEGSFRPPYCGNDKTVRFNVEDMDFSKLRNLEPVSALPDARELLEALSRPWIDHVHEYLGAMVHPSMNMPNYGREMGRILAEVSLLVHLDLSKVPGAPKKEDLVIRLVQFGIDSAGIADAGGGWPANGGHGLGRKFPILFAGVLLGDEHMTGVGRWTTRFQEDEQTFYVTRKEVELTHTERWSPDPRAKDKEPYEPEDIGLPEWGVRHFARPRADNRGWRTPYRAVNGVAIPGFALAVGIMDLRKEWNHDAYLDYAARLMQRIAASGERAKGTNAPTIFMQQMWRRYSGQCGLVWKPGPAPDSKTETK